MIDFMSHLGAAVKPIDTVHAQNCGQISYVAVGYYTDGGKKKPIVLASLGQLGNTHCCGGLEIHVANDYSSATNVSNTELLIKCIKKYQATIYQIHIWKNNWDDGAASRVVIAEVQAQLKKDFEVQLHSDYRHGTYTFVIAPKNGTTSTWWSEQ